MSEHPTNFWEDYPELSAELAEVHKRLINISLSQGTHKLLEDIWNRYRVPPEILVKFGCGIGDRIFEGVQDTWIYLPYETGLDLVQIVDGGKGSEEIPGDGTINLPVNADSKPTQAFFGTSQLPEQPGERLFLCQTPFEAMLLDFCYCQYNNSEAIGYMYPFQVIPTPPQGAWLESQTRQRNWKEIYVVKNFGAENTLGDRPLGLDCIASVIGSARLLTIDIFDQTETRHETLMELLKKPITIGRLEEMIDQAEPWDPLIDDPF